MDALKTFKRTSPSLWYKYVAGNYHKARTEHSQPTPTATWTTTSALPGGIFIKNKNTKKNTTDQENKAKTLASPMMQVWRIFNKYHISLHFNCGKTLIEGGSLKGQNTHAKTCCVYSPVQ